MDVRNDTNVVDSNFKRVTVPVYPTDPGKHLDGRTRYYELTKLAHNFMI